MNLNHVTFLQEFNISDETFSKTAYDWQDLNAIYADFYKKEREYVVAGNQILETLSLIDHVHSLKSRIKDPKHLIEKIIRKKIEDHERHITVKNYLQEITDLIGVRILHLFKDDWIKIHQDILKSWDIFEQPVAYIRKGDREDIFKANGCEIRQHEAGYRSVHYLIKHQPTKEKLYIAEIQIRTIFEEGWSEIDHRLRYPYDINNVLLNEYLKIFNRLAGSVDEMGSYIKFLKSTLAQQEKNYETERDQFNKEKEKILIEMEKLKLTLKSETKNKEHLQSIIDSYKTSSVPSYVDKMEELLVDFKNYHELFDDSSLAYYYEDTQKSDKVYCKTCRQKYNWRGLRAFKGKYKCPRCGRLN